MKRSNFNKETGWALCRNAPGDQNIFSSHLHRSSHDIGCVPVWLQRRCWELGHLHLLSLNLQPAQTFDCQRPSQKQKRHSKVLRFNMRVHERAPVSSTIWLSELYDGQQWVPNVRQVRCRMLDQNIKLLHLPADRDEMLKLSLRLKT